MTKNGRLMHLGFLLTAAAALLATGCTTTSARLSDLDLPYHESTIPKPDFIIVDPLVVVPSEMERRPGLAVISASHGTQSEHEIEVGAAFSNALRDRLVARLRAAGIDAHTRENAPSGTYKTGVLHGFYFDGTLNGQDMSLGYQVDDHAFNMRIIANMREVTIGEATVEMKTLLIDQDLDFIPAAIANEADMAAQQIVDELILPAYERRGWEL